MEILFYLIMMLFPFYFAYRVRIATHTARKYLNVSNPPITTLTHKKAQVTDNLSFIFCSAVSILASVLLAKESGWSPLVCIVWGSFVLTMNSLTIFKIDWNPEVKEIKYTEKQY